MKRKSLFCGVLALVLLFSGCAKTASPNASMKSTNQAKYSEAKSDMAVKPGESPMSPAADVKTVNTSVQTAEQKIIRNGSINIVEENLFKLAESVQNKAKEMGGYIESEEMLEYRLSVRVRIPANKFDEFIKYAEEGFDVKNKSISSENITDSYVDNEARLNNLKAQEKQILDILQKAKTVEEVLKVQAELYRIRGEAEALEARKKNWDRQVDYATLIMNADKKQIVPDNKKSILSGSEFIKSIGKGFSNTGISLVLFIQELIIFVLSNILLIAILAAAAIFGLRVWRRHNGTNNPK